MYDKACASNGKHVKFYPLWLDLYLIVKNIGYDTSQCQELGGVQSPFL